MRGIVVNPKFTIIDEKGVLLETTYITAEDLRRYLLFWDKIEFPDNNFVSLGDTNETSFLINAGIMQRSMFYLNEYSRNLGYLLAELQYKAFLENNKKENELWSIAQTSKTLILNPNDLIKKRTIEFELINCVPIPTVETPLETILEFRERRKDELMSFRNAIDLFYENVLASLDSERTRQRIIDEIQKNCSDLIKVMNESKIKMILQNLKSEANISDIFKGLVNGFRTGLISNAVFDLPALASFTIGTIVSGVQIKIDDLFQPRKIPEKLKPYAYLYYANKEIR